MRRNDPCSREPRAALLALALAVTAQLLLPARARCADSPLPPTVLRITGLAASDITIDRLRAAGTRDIPVESGHGDPVTSKAVPLLTLLESAGLESGSMASERKTAAAIVVATGRDGYTAIFSVGELSMHRSDPRVFLAAETATGPLSREQGPVRLVVTGQRARSAFALAAIEVRYLADNKPSPAR